MSVCVCECEMCVCESECACITQPEGEGALTAPVVVRSFQILCRRFTSDVTGASMLEEIGRGDNESSSLEQTLTERPRVRHSNRRIHYRPVSRTLSTRRYSERYVLKHAPLLSRRYGN